MTAPVKFKYQPREQFLDFHQRTHRWAAIPAHRRAGKTVACVNELILRALYTHKHNARYAYIAPFYRQAKDVAWMYLKQYTEDFAVRVREADLRVELPNNAFITLYGSDNPDALRGIYLDGVVMDEYGDCRPSLWPEVVLPTLAERKGWATFIGTAKGRNHFYDTVKRSRESQNWYDLTLKASETGILDEEDLQEMRAQMTAAQYAREMECDFDASVPGTYYADLINQMEIDGRISNDVAHYDSDYPVECAADLGYSDSTAFWFWQITPDGPNLIQYYENQSKVLSHYIEYLNALPFDIAKLWLPHDAKQKTLQTGRGTVEQLQEAGFKCAMTPSLKVQQGNDAGRLILPQVKINQTKCHLGIEALRAYRRSYNELTKAYSETPLHDWASDGADAFRYFALVTRLDTKKPTFDPQFDNDNPLLHNFSLNDLFEDNESQQNYRFKNMRM